MRNSVRDITYIKKTPSDRSMRYQFISDCPPIRLPSQLIFKLLSAAK